jgi:hypothetical protein
LPEFAAIPRKAPCRHLLRRATQKRQDALRVHNTLPLFMVVTVVLQIPQAALNRRFRRIHALYELLLV